MAPGQGTGGRGGHDPFPRAPAPGMSGRGYGGGLGHGGLWAMIPSRAPRAPGMLGSGYGAGPGHGRPGGAMIPSRAPRPRDVGPRLWRRYGARAAGFSVRRFGGP